MNSIKMNIQSLQKEKEIWTKEFNKGKILDETYRDTIIDLNTRIRVLVESITDLNNKEKYKKSI